MNHGFRLASLALLPLLGAAACGDSPTAPHLDIGPDDPLLVQRTTSTIASEPGFLQVGEFFYEGERLVRWELSHNLSGEMRTTIRKDFLFREDGLHAGHDHHIHVDGAWRLGRSVRYGYDTERELPIEVEIQSIEERTGNILVTTWGVRYDDFDRVVELRQGPEIHTYTYDAEGDVTRIRSDDARFGVQVTTMTHGAAWNPLADFPPLHGIPGGIFAPDVFSTHLADGWDNRVEGEEPAARATAVIEVRPDGYPSRREFTAWNTVDPDVKTTSITEFDYIDPTP